MKITIQDLKTLRQWRVGVGCDVHYFEELLVIFSQAFAALHNKQLAERMVIRPGGTRMKDEADLLLFHPVQLQIEPDV